MSTNYTPGMTPQAAAQFSMANRASATPTNLFKPNNLPVNKQDQVRTENFPIPMGSEDPKDIDFALQRQLVGPDGVIPNVGMSIAGPEYFDYAKRKMQMVEEVQFKDWLIKQANFGTPEEAEYWSRTFPWIPALKLDNVSRVSELQKTQARINITGPQTPEDWRFIWDVARGLIYIPEQPVHLLPKDKKDDGKSYQRGLFSPMVNYLPPFKAGTTYGQPGYTPNFKYVWNNPTDRTAGFNNNPLTVPKQTQSYVNPFNQ